MKKLSIMLALMAVGIAQAGVISLNSSWTAETNKADSAISISGESATGFSVDQLVRDCYVYQAVSLSDFTAEPFGIGDTATITFTTTMDADAFQPEDLDYRFMLWDEANGGAASARLDWGAPAGTVMQAGVGSGAAKTGIGTQDDAVTGSVIPNNTFNASNETATVSMSVSKTDTNLFNFVLAWDGVKIYDYNLAAVSNTLEEISAIGFRLNATTNTTNAFTISDVSVEVAPTPPGIVFTHQIGGLAGNRDQRWDEPTATNAVTPTELEYSFTPPFWFKDLQNVVITVTASEINDAIHTTSAFLAGTLGNPDRLDTNEVIVLTVSYEDPDNKLLGLKVDSFGPYWNNGLSNTVEEVLFSDGTTVVSLTNTPNDYMQVYDQTALDPLSLANTDTWQMLVYQTNNTTEAALAGFKYEIIADTQFVEKPTALPPVGDVELASDWDFGDATNNAVLGQGADWFSVAVTNDGATKLKIIKRGLNEELAVGSTARWEFTAVVGSALPLTDGDQIFQGSLADGDVDLLDGVAFQIDWGTPEGTVMTLGQSRVSGDAYYGAVRNGVSSTAIPSNILDAQGKAAPFVLAVTRLDANGTAFASLSYDDTTISTTYTNMATGFDSIDELGFRWKNGFGGHLIITNTTLSITNPDFDYYGFWVDWDTFLTPGVNDAWDTDAESDGMNNLLEYAHGGDPLVDDAAVYGSKANLDGSYLNMVYRRRLDAVNRGLGYNVTSGTALTSPITNPTEEAGSGVIDAEFELVTNRVSSAVESVQFMKLEVSQ